MMGLLAHVFVAAPFGSVAIMPRTNMEWGMSDQYPQGHNGPSIPRWVWWIGALVLLNVLSQVFHWGFVFY